MTSPQSGVQESVAPQPRNSRKVLWIVLGVIAFLLLCFIAFAAFGLYFVTQNLNMEQATVTQADRSFDDVRAKFKDAPILTLDADERVTLSRQPPAAAPAERPSTMHVMVYDTNDERIVRVTIPFWMLRMGREKIRLGPGNLEFEQLQISAEELERYGPSLLLDHRGTDRTRVLVWTQ
ncbi:MAG: hypothetical protein M3R55_04345 [Acidobacteriota bacterium]|nr:hypothetical protein [Acidobacteriota bacterium]